MLLMFALITDGGPKATAESPFFPYNWRLAWTGGVLAITSGAVRRA